VSNQFRAKLLKHFASNHKNRKTETSGFTMLEILVVVIIIGVLAAIAGPNWLAFNNRQKINSATNSVFTALRGAQSQAKKDNRPRYVTFNTATNKITGELGQSISMDSDVKIYSITNAVTGTGSCVNFYWVFFDEKGTPFNIAPPSASPCDPNLSQARSNATIPIQIKLKHNLIEQRQCVTIRTLLGSVDTSSDSSTCPP
jgi:prepilin-type N-terminal cleavage/methylation domain-containing protein